MTNITLRDIFRTFVIALILGTLIILFCLYVINRQKENTTREMANKVLKAADYYIASQMLESEFEYLSVNFPDNEKLGIRGNLPKNGYIKINSNHQVELRFYYNDFCVSKSNLEVDVKIEKTNKEKCIKKES